VIGEEQVVAEADRLVANTRFEAQDLVGCYDADPTRSPWCSRAWTWTGSGPGPTGRPPAPRSACPNAGRVAFVGRIQPLKGPTC
jgi:D-inositol-3-phosphate glycosyltransferase